MTRCHQQQRQQRGGELSSLTSHSNSQHNYRCLVHIALITTNTIFGLGSIIGKLGLHEGTNPLSFTFLREVISGSILLSLSYYFSSSSNNNNNEDDENSDVVQDDEDEENVEDDGKAALEPMLAAGKRRSDVTRRTTTTTTLILPQSMLHFRSFVMLGMLLFINQSFYLVGIQLGGPVTGSVWQPSAPIFTAVISMIWKLETWNIQRIVGVFVAFVGCSVMILLGGSSSSSGRHQDNDESNDAKDPTIQIGGGVGGSDVTETISFLIGNLLFCCQCLAASFYILLSKNLLSVYPSLTVTAWSYLLASPFMCISAFLSTKSKWSQELICPTCSSSSYSSSSFDHDVSESATTTTTSSLSSFLLNDSFSFIWIPKQTIPALAYYIFAQSVAAWGLILWSNQYATGTLVMGYSVIQPVTSLIFTILILFVIHLVPQCGMDSGTMSNDAIANANGIIVYDDDPFNSDGDSRQELHGDGEEEGQYRQCLNPPGLGTLCGIIGVVCGLSLIITTEPSKRKITTECLEDDDDGTKRLDVGSRNQQFRTNGDNCANNDNLLSSSIGYYTNYGSGDHPPNE